MTTTAMAIEEIKGYKTGVSGIEIEGTVTDVETPEHREGEGKKGHYDFWSQKVWIDDGTGIFECSIGVKSEDDGIKAGVVARIKGKITEYPANSGNRKLQGSLVGISRRDGKVTDVQQKRAEEYFENKKEEECLKSTKTLQKGTEEKSNITKDTSVDKWEAKDLRIAHECAVKAITELVANKIMESKEFFNFADTIIKYIYNGNGGGKKKALKPISKAEDFIAPADMPD